MNSFHRIFRAIMWGIVTAGMVSFVRQASDLRRMTSAVPPQKAPTAVRLQRDPACGTYVSPEVSVKLEKSGTITHFCSVECRQRYLGSAARAAGT